jgi:hypothetical protein
VQHGHYRPHVLAEVPPGLLLKGLLPALQLLMRQNV